MSADYIRRCPTCGAENAPHVMRCACGALLAGVDLVVRQAPAAATCAAPLAASVSGSVEADSVLCAYDDCGQNNPPGSEHCLYCNRPLARPATPASSDQLQSLLSLPGVLKDRYRIIKPLPARGAEAELLLVEQSAGGPPLVAKIYRNGIQPRPDVQQRIARIDPRHCVRMLEVGTAEGYAYELMEFCSHGSLREIMRAGPMVGDFLSPLVREIASAIGAVHAVGLLHRDLKPENILVRGRQPLDLVLTDFGIASILDATQRFTGTARTLPYASPESLSGVIDGKADYWALGIVILEASLGRHPFAGLSEAVILHQLTTRAIDLVEITDHNVRKLLRGLLLRDPKARWGDAEITRWLANDPNLLEPAEQGAASGFAQPYHVARETCYTMEQLAVALARNWREGIADMANGLLQSWFRDVQKNQNVERLLIELRHESGLSADVQLLKLILHLAPGIPPVWRGESIELRAILSQANLALKGDAGAAHWLHLLYQHRVLEAYAEAGNAECAGIVQRWGRACDQFVDAWAAGLALIKEKTPARGADEYVNFDQLLYGKSEPERPSMATMHARLLATAYDAEWAERLRRRVTAELASLMVHCPWLGELGDPLTMSAASLLVLESLIPEAGKAADRQIRADARQRQSATDECAALAAEFVRLTGAMRAAASDSLLMLMAGNELAASLDRYFELLARIRMSGRSDLPWQEMRRTVVRVESVANGLRRLIDTLAEQQAVNAGWMSVPVLGFTALAMILLPALLGPRAFYWLLAGGLAIAAWRLLPTLGLIRRIRALAYRL